MNHLTRSTLALAVCLAACSKKPAPTPAAPSLPPAEQAVEGTKIRTPSPLKNLYFEFDSDAVSKQDMARILRDCLAYSGPRTLSGYASGERSGKYKETASVACNMALSARRANSVKLSYTISGCPDVSVQYFGETYKWGKNLPRNRRVVIER